MKTACACVLLALVACGGAQHATYPRRPNPNVCEANPSPASASNRDADNSLATIPDPNVDADAEREAVLAAMRQHINAAGGNALLLEARKLRVDNNWAWLEVNSSSVGGSLHHKRQAALLQKQDARWVVLENIPEGGELERLGLAAAAEYVATLRARHPEAPASVFPAL